MQGVDTLIAFPQWYINYNLNKLLNDKKPGNPIKEVHITLGDFQLNGNVQDIWINVHVTGSDYKIKFILSFSKGTMDYKDLVSSKSMQVNIDGLQVGFDVDLSYEDLENNQTVPDDVKKQVEKLINYFGAGAVTIQQLLMDFQNAVLSQYDPTVTKFPTTMDSSAKAMFALYLQTYIFTLQQTGGNILGYAIKIDNPGSHPDPVATFPPTSLHFITNQYEPPSEMTKDLDTLNYLLMTNGNTFPRIDKNYWGNYIVPEDDIKGCYGTMAISKKLFFQDYLLPKISTFVNKYWTFSTDPKSLDPKWEEKSGNFDEEGTFRSENSSAHTEEKSDEAFFNLSVFTTASYCPTKNEIIIERETMFDIEVKHHSLKTSRFKCWYKVPLTITISLNGINEGKLEVSVLAVTEPNPDPSIVSDMPMWWLVEKTEGELGIGTQKVELLLDNFCKKSVDTSLLNGIVDEISNSLHFNTFVFPFGSQLYMSDPIFNNEGDLLIGLKSKY